jgi:hypothetical protein
VAKRLYARRNVTRLIWAVIHRCACKIDIVKRRLVRENAGRLPPVAETNHSGSLADLNEAAVRQTLRVCAEQSSVS